MTALTKGMRDALERALLDRALQERRDALAAGRAALAVAIYEASYSAARRAQMAELPAGWLPETRSLTVQFPGDYEHLSFGKGCTARIPAQDTQRVHQFDAKHAFTKTFNGLNKEENAISAEELKLKQAIRGQTYAVGSVEQLVKRWPEVASVVRSLFPAPTVKLPVPVPAKVNEALRLP